MSEKKQSESWERRYFSEPDEDMDLEVREGEDKRPVITGHAAVFNRAVEIFGFSEMFLPGAFAETIQKDDVRALWNHDPMFVLGRRSAGTLDLAEDKKGLAVTIRPPDAQWANDLVETIRRRDVTGQSIAFRAVTEKFERIEGKELRRISKANLRDVGPVTFPAYKQTDVAVRSFLDLISPDEPAVRAAVLRVQQDQDLEARDVEALGQAIESLRKLLPEGSGEEARRIRPTLDILRRKLDLAEL